MKALRLSRPYTAVAALILLSACQTTSAVDYSQANQVIRAGYPDITVAPEPGRSFNREDGSVCEEFRYFQPGDDGLARQGLAVVCRYEGQNWVLVSRKLDKTLDAIPETPAGGGKKWAPVTGG